MKIFISELCCVLFRLSLIYILQDFYRLFDEIEANGANRYRYRSEISLFHFEFCQLHKEKWKVEMSKKKEKKKECPRIWVKLDDEWNWLLETRKHSKSPSNIFRIIASVIWFIASRKRSSQAKFSLRIIAFFYDLSQYFVQRHRALSSTHSQPPTTLSLFLFVIPSQMRWATGRMMNFQMSDLYQTVQTLFHFLSLFPSTFRS